MSHIDEGELTAYADGAYAPGEGDALRIEAHLADCANCRNRLAQAKSLSARATEIVAFASPVSIEHVPFETIAATTTQPKRWMPYAWAASLIMAIGLGWLSRDLLITQLAEAPQIAAAPSVTAPTASVQSDAKIEMQETRPTAPTVTSRPTALARDTTVVVAAGPPAAAPAPAPAAAAEIASTANAGAGAESLARLQLDARAVAAFDTSHVIRGLEIVSQRLEENNLVTTQKLPDGVLVTLTRQEVVVTRDEGVAKSLSSTQQRAAAERKATDLKLPEVMVRRGTTIIRIKGALSADSLRALAKKIR